MEVGQEFKLADSVIPKLEEGKYIVKGMQNVSMPQAENFEIAKEFYVAGNAEIVTENEVFCVYPAVQQQGDFSGTLPFIVFHDRSYPWVRKWTEDIAGNRVPWLALLVIAENEGAMEKDMKYSQLEELKESNIFFPYSDSQSVTLCGKEDTIHILTIPKETYEAVMPQKQDLCWLAHAKYINLSAVEDSISQKDGWFSTIIANRFLPSSKGKSIKSTIHLVAIDQYLNGEIPKESEYVCFISLYHWAVYSEKTEDKSFTSLVNGLADNTREVKGMDLKTHYLRTGEKTYSVYHSPLLPYCTKRYDEINGEERFTADGRLIYDAETGIFDVSYSAAFNLGRLITLSRCTEAEKIIAWRKENEIKKHLKMQDLTIGFDETDLKELCGFLAKGSL